MIEAPARFRTADYETLSLETELYAEVPGLHQSPEFRSLVRQPETRRVEVMHGDRLLSAKEFGGSQDYIVGVERYIPDGAWSGCPVYRVISLKS